MRFGTFFDGVVTRQEAACLASFLRCGHEVTVFSYGSLDLPKGVVRRDARSIIPRDSFYTIETGPHRGSASQFSDQFRYVMIKRTGLVWIDTDVFCLRADWPDRPFLFAGQDNCLINGAVLGLPRDHPFVDDAIEVATRLGRLPIWAYTGPHLITALVQQYELGGHVLASQSFYPIHYSQAGALLSPLPAGQKLQWPAISYCVHFWNELLRNWGHDKSVGPPPGSPMAQLFESVSSSLSV